MCTIDYSLNIDISSVEERRKLQATHHESRSIWCPKGRNSAIIIVTDWPLRPQYDVKSLNDINGEDSDVKFSFFDALLDQKTAILARGHDAVCIFVNDVCDAGVIEQLSGLQVVRSFALDQRDRPTTVLSPEIHRPSMRRLQQRRSRGRREVRYQSRSGPSVFP